MPRNCTKDVQDMYIKNYKILLKEIKEGWDWRRSLSGRELA
jgi:hypothetical protein